MHVHIRTNSLGEMVTTELGRGKPNTQSWTEGKCGNGQAGSLCRSGKGLFGWGRGRVGPDEI